MRKVRSAGALRRQCAVCAQQAVTRYEGSTVAGRPRRDMARNGAQRAWHAQRACTYVRTYSVGVRWGSAAQRARQVAGVRAMAQKAGRQVRAAGGGAGGEGWNGGGTAVAYRPATKKKIEGKIVMFKQKGMGR